ncbi:hypothetical protein VPH35_071638 [Triticum aestivum]
MDENYWLSSVFWAVRSVSRDLYFSSLADPLGSARYPASVLFFPYPCSFPYLFPLPLDPLCHFEHYHGDCHGDLELPLAARSSWLVMTCPCSPSLCLAPSASPLFLPPKACSISRPPHPPRPHYFATRQFCSSDLIHNFIRLWECVYHSYDA